MSKQAEREPPGQSLGVGVGGVGDGGVGDGGVGDGGVGDGGVGDGGKSGWVVSMSPNIKLLKV